MTSLILIIINCIAVFVCIGVCLTGITFIIEPVLVVDCFKEIFKFRIGSLPNYTDIRSKNINAEILTVIIILISFISTLVTLGLLYFLSLLTN